MNGSLFFALGLFLAIIALTKGIPGGLGPQSPAGPGEQALVTKNRNAIIRKLPSFMQGPFGPFKALTYKTQVVQGTNYFIKVKIQGGRGVRDRFIHVRIYAGLNNRSRVDGVQTVSQYDPILFF
uniref:Cystatin-A-like n=1 Tax=Crassostrea virginica TaxID=6565 RepID=A0A8B8B7W7_CRAVI|nr:cystatin-A-like [Crassostrea virginica]